MEDILIRSVIKGMNENLYNGHSRVGLEQVELTLKDAKILVTALEGDINENKEHDDGTFITVVALYHADGSGNIIALNFWGEDEHPMGERDKLLFTWEGTQEY